MMATATATANSGIMVRDAVRRYIEGVLEADMPPEQLREELTRDFSSEDRAFFQEVTLGSLREWMFLDWVVERYAPRRPRGSVRTVLNMSAYQLLFLDRVPDYAIFSQASAISSSLGVSEPELKFVHGVLKSVQRDKSNLLMVREASLDRLRSGAAPDSALEWAVLNAPQALVDALTVVLEKGKKKEARMRAIRALVLMKERSRLVGYALPGQEPKTIFSSLSSPVAPRAIVLQSSSEMAADLAAGVLRIQGEASQWSCELAAEALQRLRQEASGRPLRVLEMAAGKGGKLIGTLSAWTALAGGDSASLPALEWVASDASERQLRLLEEDTLKMVSRYWPQVEISLIKRDWSASDRPAGIEPKSFDLVWLDAPCTGFGTISKLPEIGLRRGEQAYDEALKLAQIQKEMCRQGMALVKPNGHFVYSVCTTTRPETIGLLEELFKECGVRPSFAQSIWPGSPPAPQAEGFFVAIY